MARSIPELWVLRHGETEWNVASRLQGHLDSPLTPRGIAQAKAQGAILRTHLPGEVAVIASPSGRAWRSAEIACAGLGLAPEADPALREVDVGGWQGQTRAEVLARHSDLPVDADPHLWKFTAPGGETLAAMTARLEGVLARLRGPTVLVTHGVTSRLLRCLVLGRPATELSALPGGQGVVHHIRDGVARILERYSRIRYFCIPSATGTPL